MSGSANHARSRKGSVHCVIVGATKDLLQNDGVSTGTGGTGRNVRNSRMLRRRDMQDRTDCNDNNACSTDVCYKNGCYNGFSQSYRALMECHARSEATRAMRMDCWSACRYSHTWRWMGATRLGAIAVSQSVRMN